MTKAICSQQHIQKIVFTDSEDMKDQITQSFLYGFIPKTLYNRLCNILTSTKKCEEVNE
ncbi:7267_t:CDS:2 [Gigaspora margarita]|uniref:7267_t:CDS:1 n=1 Tax=Gigaspora margarita TaxID=4874 RepID=A0ABN7UKE6_GIGMA|nr:7267_t:CDS:2 [Gigaspora margarita]